MQYRPRTQNEIKIAETQEVAIEKHEADDGVDLHQVVNKSLPKEESIYS